MKDKLASLFNVLLLPGLIALVISITVYWRPIKAVTVYTVQYAANEVAVLFMGSPGRYS